MKSIEHRIFKSDNDSRAFQVPYTLSPEIKIIEEELLPALRPESEEKLKEHYENLKASPLNKGGMAIIFGTFDNLHVGHKIMLQTAQTLSKELYIGIEDRQMALIRKNFKHPILSNEDRIQMLKEAGFNHVFIRTSALNDIKRLQQEGKDIKTLAVGETQKDNAEMVDAVEYCVNNGVQVVAITRSQVANSKRQISSSILHQLGVAKLNGR